MEVMFLFVLKSMILGFCKTAPVNFDHELFYKEHSSLVLIYILLLLLLYNIE